MIKRLLIASAMSFAAVSLSAVAHEENDTAAVTKTKHAAAEHRAGGKGHARAEDKKVEHGASEKETHASALGQPGVAAQVTRTMQVDMNDTMRYTPNRLSVKRGDTVRFIVKNSGKLKHEMVLGSIAELKEHAAMMRKMPKMEHADENMVSVEPGKTGELVWRFTKAGQFDFACLQPGHFEAGMQGKVAVK